MTSKSETGHAKNVANFEDLISFCTNYGTAYNPSKISIKLPALNTLFTNAKNSLTAGNTAHALFIKAVNEREIAFNPLSRLTTKIINALDATDAIPQIVNDAKTNARKIQGARKSKKIQTIIDDPGTPINEAQKSVSASQMSYDMRIENFS